MWENEPDYLVHEDEREEAAQQQFQRDYGAPLESPPNEKLISVISLGTDALSSEKGFQWNPPLLNAESSQKLDFQLADVPPQEDYEPCTPGNNAYNSHEIRRLREEAISRLRGIADWGRTRGLNSFDTTEMVRLVEDYNANGRARYMILACHPSGTYALNVIRNEFIPAFQAAVRQKDRGVGIVWDNANRELTKLRTAFTAVSDARREFENTHTGGLGLIGITSAHDEFLLQSKLTRSFTLTNFDFRDGRIEDPDKFSKQILTLEHSEARESAITDLDRLRDEYVVKARPVPFPDEFTTSKSSAHFSFDELNSGQYRWAVIKNSFLSKLEITRKLVGNKELRVFSGYRNPVHNDSSIGRGGKPGNKNSRHQYGDAGDVYTEEDLTGDGKIDIADGDKLQTAARNAGFNEVLRNGKITVHMADDPNQNIS